MGTFKRNWWIIAIQGLFLIGIGSLSAFKVVMDINSLVSYLALIFLVFGIILSLWALRARSKGGHWGVMFGIGVLEAALGLIILAYPTDSTAIFLKVIGGFALLIGLIQLILGFTVKQNRPMFFINALLSAVFGTLIILNPFDEKETLTFVVGFYCIILGMGFIYYGFKLRNWSTSKIQKAEEKRLEKERIEKEKEPEKTPE